MSIIGICVTGKRSSQSLEITKKSARTAYHNADKDGKALLENLLGKEVFSEKITDRIKTFEDALEETGRPAVPDFAELPEELRTYMQSQYRAVVLAEALNEGWKPDYSDDNQPKYYPWFDTEAPGGFRFYGTHSAYSLPHAGDAARLCFKNRELAEYAGRQFTEIYKGIILG